jgi:hypothetical protein
LIAIEGHEHSVRLLGAFVVRNAGREVGRFAIDLVIPPTFPTDLPTLTETSFKIPRHPDSHINPDSSCCIGLPADIFRRLGKQFSVCAYLNGPVKDYFLGQLSVEAGLGWPQGENDHGALGVLQYWRLHFPTESRGEISNLLLYCSRGKLPRKNSHCPCGRRVRSRKCHRSEIRKILSTYPLSILGHDASTLQ